MSDHFRTKFPPFQSSLPVMHSDRALCVGSCFAEHIGSRLNRLKFPVLVNPFGIIYNPVSVGQSLKKLMSDDPFQEEDVFKNLGLWHSFAHHGRFSHPDKTLALDNINRSLAGARAFLEQASRLIVTLGSANVFVFKKTAQIVSNCHKVPGQEFDHRRLGTAEVVQALLPVFETLRKRSPSLEVIATVSPVRHLRDGLVENQRSKATLLLALEEICRCLPFVHYFPAYEILLDDLRDYRFYEADLMHPNIMAVDYIWQYFEEAYFDENTKSLCRRIEQVKAAAAHRPFHPQSDEHQHFIKKMLGEIARLEAENPGLNFEEEKSSFLSEQRFIE